jgi:hypothetical protein
MANPTVITLTFERAAESTFKRRKAKFYNNTFVSGCVRSRPGTTGTYIPAFAPLLCQHRPNST